MADKSPEKKVQFDKAPESIEEQLKLVARGFCIIGGEVIPDGQKKCVGHELYQCINGGLYLVGKC